MERVFDLLRALEAHCPGVRKAARTLPMNPQADAQGSKLSADSLRIEMGRPSFHGPGKGGV